MKKQTKIFWFKTFHIILWLGRNHCVLGSIEDLVYMRLPELEGAMFVDEIDNGMHDMGRWAVFG